ncbi:MAG TPA: carboxymuconolactone decarboxylase family protein [Thermodesulfobacteriota bacterium]|mgnify:CR=1 FL=1|nr:carboxymuconolactone decarboxylase family protein [Deltaproteobacteria bacterium]HNR13878.1 carboxymuconolactone decarboxylase family protein [Thermodesulfobacteriota bacterium]HNU70556.1 carboxymuconolactone decarboxylase family protein [Thermodesulfobacteriota bacterium]
MSNDVVEKTRKTAALYFDGWEDERPYSLWQSFDRERAADFSLFITGKLYAREKIPHRTRQLVAVAGLAALERTDELKLHLHAALNVGCTVEEVTEVLFQMATYAGMPVVNSALKAFREVLQKRNMWPLER